MSHVPDEVRDVRTAALAPLFAVLAERGVKRGWLARQIGPAGISLNSLWRYEHGYDRVPPLFIKQACQALGIPSSLIPIPEPRDLYIQQPRSAKSKTTERTERQDDPQEPQRRVRRTQPTPPTTTSGTAAHHTPRHGAATRRANRSSSDDASATSDPASGGRAAADATSRSGRRVARSRHRASVGSGLAVTGQP